MGLLFSRFHKEGCPRERRILMIGLDSVGKTTILYKLKQGKTVTTMPIPTIGYNLETIEHKNINFSVCDAGGQEKIRPLWNQYSQNVQGLIFVVDSNDRYRVDLARNELHSICNEEELKEVPLLVYANLQDLPNVWSTTELTDKLGLGVLLNRQWHIEACCATTGDGVQEGWDWLASSFIPQKVKNSNKI